MDFPPFQKTNFKAIHFVILFENETYKPTSKDIETTLVKAFGAAAADGI